MFKELLLIAAMIVPNNKIPKHKLFKLWLYVPKTESIYILVKPPSYIYDENCEPIGGHDAYIYHRDASKAFQRCVIKL